ncbi:MAG: hypothetical protein KBA95_14940, partial [Acidobacteria bacterium]|nr:hypothetical protein [Acidobacteriota bacterium]
MSARVHAIGIDIGSLYVKGVAIDASGRAIWRRTSRHQGNVAGLVEQYLGGANGARVGLTTRGWAPSGTVPLDQVLCLAAGVRALCPDAANILEVGGSSLTLVRLDPAGQIQSVHRNSLCAAGTGSFLDEQAARLNLDVESLDGSPVPQPPSIAARCAVFAESDLIHRQQEGYSKEVLWSGLCRGLADGVIRALTHGQPLWGRTALSGGVALNGSFVWWLRQALDAHAVNGCGASIEVVPGPEFTMALGAALLAAAGPPATPQAAGAEGSVEIARPAAPGNTPDDAPARLAPGGCRTRPALTLLRSRYPERRQLLNETDPAGNEVSVHRLPADGARRTRVFLGVDVGSTSTKCALVGEDGLIVADVYRRTEGDPIGAARALLNAVVAIDRAHGFGFEVLGAATTGSGRKLVGTVIGADLVVNEISAHGAGALAADPKVETIFEIGGQDAKYLWVQDGRVADANMNYVCAAGTGSFVEALAAKLGYGPAESGEAVLGVAPPFTSSRCTVFMEQDVLGLVQRGASPAQAMGAVMYSVVENYLERVVGRRRVSRDRVVFQGATARNRGLVAAIENLLGVEVVVSPYCHVMGAYGAALLSRGSVAGGRTRFRGLDLGHRAITLEDETCRLCANACRVSRVSIEGVEERPAWGMLCGREDGERRRRTPPGYATYRRRARLACTPQRPAGAAGTASGAASSDTRPVVVVPRALTAYSFYPFWSAFFDSLGIEARLGPPTDQACLDLGKQCAGPELCLPLKTAHGHAASLLGDASAPVVFLPHMIADERVPGLPNAKF